MCVIKMPSHLTWKVQIYSIDIEMDRQFSCNVSFFTMSWPDRNDMRVDLEAPLSWKPSIADLVE